MRELGGGGGYAGKVRPAGHHVLGEWGCAPVRRGCAGGGGGCAGQARLVRPPGGAPIRRGWQATMWGERCAGQAIMCIVGQCMCMSHSS